MSGQKGVLSVSPAEDREELPFPLAGKSSYIPTLLAGEAEQSASTFSKPTPETSCITVCCKTSQQKGEL